MPFVIVRPVRVIATKFGSVLKLTGSKVMDLFTDVVNARLVDCRGKLVTISDKVPVPCAA